MQLTDNPYFEILIKEAKEISSVSLNDLMNQKNRADDFCFSLDPLWVDISRQLITRTIFDNLIKLAEASRIEEDRPRQPVSGGAPDGLTCNIFRNGMVTPASASALRLRHQLTGDHHAARRDPGWYRPWQALLSPTRPRPQG